MARSSNPELLKRYRMKLSQCKRMRKQEQCDDTWKRMLDLYRGRHYENYSDEDRLLVNMAFSQLTLLHPAFLLTTLKLLFLLGVQRTLTRLPSLRLLLTIGGDTMGVSHSFVLL